MAWLESIASLAGAGSFLFAAIEIRKGYRDQREEMRMQRLTLLPESSQTDYADTVLPQIIAGPRGDIRTLREGRVLPVSWLRRGLIEGDSQSLVLWQKYQEQSIDTDNKPWEQQFAYQTTLALERIGVSIFSGVIPLDVMLAVHTVPLVEDWILCYRLVGRIRENYRLEQCGGRLPTSPVGFARRHGEWLACLAGLEVMSQWSGPLASFLGRNERTLISFGLSFYEREEQIRRMERHLLSADTERVALSVRRNYRKSHRHSGT